MATLRSTAPKLAGPDLARPGRHQPSTNGFGPSVPTLRRRRNVPGAVLGVLIVTVCAFAIGSWALSVNHRTQVLVVSRLVPAGSVIQASDLTASGVAAGHAVAAIPASASSQVIGKVALETLVPGSLVVRAEVGAGPQVPAGSSVVGLDLKPGMFPAALQVGDTVSVVATPAQAGIWWGWIGPGRNRHGVFCRGEPGRHDHAGVGHGAVRASPGGGRGRRPGEYQPGLGRDGSG